ncbi:MAG: UDP-N-acetylmuramoyl-L-alanyl-D-glutamate--2,6-diaminopimelate ligase [Oscillospiraceae bacterium]|nr:UDP-N-acetylmuramoyl-L-alanyl-D-glutamate--2,6-diaminopimelate ligase [Oscillospiraceae bacterium]
MLLSKILGGIKVIESNAKPQTEIGGISYDSRKTQPGDIFVAISGFETDGHKYIEAALKNGAAVILCERKPQCECSFVVTDNSRYALAIASKNFFDDPAGKMTVIGLTGTNGKTTTSYLLKHIIEECTGAKTGLVGTINNLIGSEIIPTEHTTPESFELQKLLAEMNDAGCSYVIMEVSSHSLKLDRVAGIRFDVAEFTNLTQDHLDFHKSMDDYAASKKKLFSCCNTACINLDDEWSSYFLDGLSCMVNTYSIQDSSAEYYADEILCTEKGASFTVHYKNECRNVHIPIPGLFSVHNALGALAVCCSAGLDFNSCCDALCSAKGVKGRLEIVDSEEDFTVIIDYAHTPDALKNVLNTLRPLTKGRLITLFGCGGDRDRTKRSIMGSVAAELSDLCIVTSDNPRTEDPIEIIHDIMPGVYAYNTPYTVISDRIEAIHWAIDNAARGDVILLAGKGHEDYQIIGHVKHHMDEREIVSSYLKGKDR